MGLRIINKEKSAFESKKNVALRNRMIEAEAKRWSVAKVGNIEELHDEFLRKIKKIRETLATPAQASTKAASLESLIKDPENAGIHTQASLNPKTLLDLL